ncbi:hypothetical protein [Candidatus Odyssella acanthamoebae]|uniref:Uncharacterized protein n=1 Tax=Candidatus Odyssella acanthamoebae TaxID=91604 RepID=A0A077ATK6_9PROT|nr:hypothetical protein [Candidatus Paracaedibacter acanthamoebae]AIK96507.1 hypothetical protein ID47_06760 [Candidatus Paracaedibacter acanthamoebae]
MNKILYFTIVALLSPCLAMDIQTEKCPKFILKKVDSKQKDRPSSKKVHFADNEKDDTWVGKGFNRIGHNIELTTIVTQNTLFHQDAVSYYPYKSESYYRMMDALQNLSFFTKLISLDPAVVKLTGLTTTQYVLSDCTLQTTLEEMNKHAKFFLHAHFWATNHLTAKGIEDAGTLEYLEELSKVHKLYLVTLALKPDLKGKPTESIFSIMALWNDMFNQALANLKALGLMHSTPYNRKDTFDNILKNEMRCLYTVNTIGTKRSTKQHRLHHFRKKCH